MKNTAIDFTITFVLTFLLLTWAGHTFGTKDTVCNCDCTAPIESELKNGQ